MNTSKIGRQIDSAYDETKNTSKCTNIFSQ